MKGRKNKSTLISSSSRSVCPMHIQEAHRTLRPRPSFCSNLVPLFSLPTQRKLRQASPVLVVGTTTESILTYVRHPLISSLPSLIAPPR